MNAGPRADGSICSIRGVRLIGPQGLRGWRRVFPAGAVERLALIALGRLVAVRLSEYDEPQPDLALLRRRDDRAGSRRGLEVSALPAVIADLQRLFG